MKVPMQKRSQESYERLLKATERTLNRTGSADFSIPDISRASGISVGGIYRRFHDKQALIADVQRRFNQRFVESQLQLDTAAALACGSLPALVRVLIPGYALLVRKNARMIRALVDAARLYPEVEKSGSRAFSESSQRFVKRLLARRDEIRHSDPEIAARFCFICLGEVIFTHLGIGRQITRHYTSWDILIRELQSLCLNYLRARET